MKRKNTNQFDRAIVLRALTIALSISAVSGFTITPSPLVKQSLLQKGTHQSGSSRFVYHGAVVDSSSITVCVETWRQYVPLIVSVGIIIDILLGNPLANAILRPMRPEDEGKSDEGDDVKKGNEKPKSKARIDAELVAQQALDKANNALELKNFLEERKTDYDRMEEMKRKLDASMQDLDEDMERRQKSIDERRTD